MSSHEPGGSRRPLLRPGPWLTEHDFVEAVVVASLLFAIARTTEALISREAGLIVAFTAISFYFLFRLRHPIGVVYILLTAAGIWGLPALLGERIARGVIIPGLIFFGAAATPTLLLWLRSRRKNEWEELP